MTLSENIEENITTTNKRPRGRPINPARHLPDGSYNKQCLDPEYYKNWYHKHYCVPYTCELCGRKLANNQKVKTHQASAVCKKTQYKLINGST